MPVYIDASTLIDAAKSGLGPDWQPGQPKPVGWDRFLNDLISGNGQEIINSVIYLEATGNPNAPDAGPLQEWLDQHIGTDIINHELDPIDFQKYANTSDGGEKSIVEVTAKHPQYGSPNPADFKFYTSDSNFAGENWYTSKGYNLSNITDLPSHVAKTFYDNPTESNYFKLIDLQNSASDVGRNIYNKALYDSPIPTDGRFPDSPTFDFFNRITFDDLGYYELPTGVTISWDDIDRAIQLDLLRWAGELVGAGAVLLDAWNTQKAFADALAKGDLGLADELLGGLIGRAFGGAFLAAVAGGAGAGIWGGPAGAIVGAILGGIVGAIGGEGIGEWLLGALGDLGFSAADLLEDLAGLLRNILADPIVLDLDGDGIELTSLATSTTRFDLDNDGFDERTGWVSPQDGLLFHDLNHNGTVDGIEELFGNSDIDGYDELALIDSNADGRIDAADPDFADLLVWKDLNSDGEATPDEILTLAQAGIARFNLSYTQVDDELQGNTVARIGSYVRTAGGNRSMASVEFALDQSEITQEIPANAELGDLLILPNLPASPSVPDLRTAIYYDSTLRDLVEDLVFGDHDFERFADFAGGGQDMADFSEVDGKFIEVLCRWAGVDMNQQPDPEQPYYLKVFEAVSGIPLEVTNDHQRERLAELWPELVKSLGVRFLVQAANAAELSVSYDLAEALAELDPDDATYQAQLEAIAEQSIDDMALATYAYDFLAPFANLIYNPASGEISGNFDQFVGAIIADQPPFATLTVQGGVPSPFPGSSLGENEHPWTAWYEEHGSMLFAVADAMNIPQGYVQTVTGWRWLFGEMTTLEGTSGVDLMDQAITYYEKVVAVSGPGGEVLAIVQIPTHDQLMFGFEGNDELRGNDGVDRLVGGTGDDLLLGGTGDDMYVYSAGDGLDRITDQSGAADVIYLSSELDKEDLAVIRLGSTGDLQLRFGSTGSGIILTNQWTTAATAIEQFQFVAEDTMDSGDIASIYLESLATSGNDTIVGSWASETLVGFAGDDVLSGGTGGDILDGGEGADKLNGQADADALFGGAGNDELDGGAGVDILVGGTGNDLLWGGGSADTYRFGRGDGQDTLNDYRNSAGGSGGVDTIELGSGVSPEDVVVTQVNGGEDLVLSIVGTSDTLTIINTIDHSNSRVEQVVFADGTVWTHADLMTRSMLANSGNDTFYGSYDGEAVTGGAGDDILYGRGGNDTIIGGTGNDQLTGDNGSDTYVFGLGDGQDLIRDFYHGGGGTDVVLLGAGITPDDIVVTETTNVNDLVITISGTTDVLTLRSTLDHSNYRIEQVQFADGTVWTHADLIARLTAANSGDDTFYGGYDADILNGGIGNDTLYGRGGNDVLNGGSGQDTLSGAGGSDTYLFNLGDGEDDIREFGGGGGSGGTDIVQLGAGIDPTDVIVTQKSAGDGLVLSIAGTTDQLTISETFTHSNYRVEAVHFDNGTIWTHAELLSRSIAANTGADTFYGSYDAETLTGGAGDDYLYGRGGNDLIIGGAGNDHLYGDGGSDTFLFELGDGQDIIREYGGAGGSGGSDTLEFGAGITAGDIVVTQSAVGNDLVLAIAGTTDQITLQETLDHANYRVEQVKFADGTIWTHADLMARSMLANGGDDIFYGGGDADTLTGGAGNDTLDSRAGSDILIGGGGQDTMTGGSGADRFVFGEGDFAGITIGTADWIKDFSRSGGDKIDLSAVDAIAGGSDDAFSFIGTNTFSNVAGELRYQISGSTTMIFGDTDGDGAEDFAIQFSGGIAFIATDFTL